jgi:hypothetical protein
MGKIFLLTFLFIGQADSMRIEPLAASTPGRIRRCLEVPAAREHPDCLETRPVGPRPAPPHQRRSRPQRAALALLTGHGASIDIPTPAGKLVFVIFAVRSGIRARPDLRANESWPCVGSRPRMKRRCALQDDCGESAPCHGCHGAKGNESSGLVQRIEYYPANALPACHAGRQVREGRAESHRSRTDTASARKETVNAMALPRFSVQLLLGPREQVVQGFP